MNTAKYSNSAGWTLHYNDVVSTDDIDEIRRLLEDEVPYERIDTIIDLVGRFCCESQTMADIRSFHDREFVAPLMAFPYVGCSADWIDNAWVIDGDTRMHGAHTVVHEDEDGRWRILRREDDLDEDGNSVTTDLLEDTFCTPLAALTAYRSQA